MITSKILNGYSAIDGCFKYSDSDSTIDCYVISRSRLTKGLSNNDWELKTNGIYILVGEQNNKTMAYVGQAVHGKDGDSIIRRLIQHLNAPREKYCPYWTQAIIFVCKNNDPNLMWDTAIIDDLEALLIRDTQPQYSWNSKEESIKNPMSLEKARSHSKKLLSIKDYIKELNFKFFDEIVETTTNNDITDENAQAALVKQLLDKTIPLETINLDPNAKVPEYTTDEKIVKQMLDLVDWKNVDHTTTFFDPACKGGEFLALIHDHLMNVLTNDKFFSEFKGQEKYIRIHDYIINNMIFGIAIGDNSFKKSKERVYRCRHIIKLNSKYIEYIKNRDKAFWQKIRKILLGDKDMRFNIIIGNPPYQENVGGGLNNSGGEALFDSFIMNGINEAEDVVCMITPTKWISGGQKNFIELRHKLVDDGHLKNMVEYFNPTVIFPGPQIAGGVSYFYYDKNYVGTTDYVSHILGKQYRGTRELSGGDIIPRHYVGETVISKIKKKTDSYLDSIVYKDYWKLPTNFNDGSVIDTNPNDIKVITPKEELFINYYEGCKSLGSFKVTFTRAVSGSTYYIDNKKTILSNIRILNPGEICNASYMVIPNIKKYEYASNIKSFLETKLVRFLILQTLFGVGLTPDRFKYVPIVDFSKHWNDESLYQYFELEQSETDFIDSIIRPIDSSDLHDTSNEYKCTPEDIQANYINQIINNQQGHNTLDKDDIAMKKNDTNNKQQFTVFGELSQDEYKAFLNLV